MVGRNAAQLDAMHGGLTLERYATVSAYLAYFRRVAAQTLVLERLGIDAREWEVAASGWSTAMADEVIGGSKELTRSFGAAFMETKHHLEQTRPTVEALVPLESRAVTPPDFDGTAPMPVLRDEPELPFRPPTAEQLSRLTLSQPKSLAAQSGETVEAAVYREEPTDPTLPFLRVAALESTWTTANYASFCAELAMFPDRRAEVLVRYGVEDDGARRMLDSEWAGRMARHPATRDEFEELYARYRAFLMAERGRGG